MNMAGLSFNALPPIHIPFRFFATAPLFMLAAALLIIFSGESLWFTRWHPNMLALTHCLTLGFIASIMMGALIQLLPVLGGIGFAKVNIVGPACHFLLVSGSSLLIANFIWPSTHLAFCAGVLLILGFSLFLFSALWVLSKKLSQGDTIKGIRLAIAALFIMLILALLLQSRQIEPSLITPNKVLTNLHAAWGLLAWVGLMIMSVSFQFIPMFHITRAFPRFISKALPLSLFILLIISFYGLIEPKFNPWVVSLALILNGIFALAMIWVLQQRKRTLADTTVNYWYLSAVSLLALNLFYFLPESLWPSAIINKYELVLAFIFIYLFVISVIEGMLLKILAFLSYTHLQQRCLADFSALSLLPNMLDFVNKKHGQYLFYSHIIAAISLLACIIKPQLYLIGGICMLVEFTLLLFIMLKAFNLYKQSSVKIEAEITKNKAA